MSISMLGSLPLVRGTQSEKTVRPNTSSFLWLSSSLTDCRIVLASQVHSERPTLQQSMLLIRNESSPFCFPQNSKHYRLNEFINWNPCLQWGSIEKCSLGKCLVMSEVSVFAGKTFRAWVQPLLSHIEMVTIVICKPEIMPTIIRTWSWSCNFHSYEKCLLLKPSVLWWTVKIPCVIVWT